MRKLNLRFGESGEDLHARLVDLAAREDMSLNSLILNLLRTAVDIRAHGMVVLLTGMMTDPGRQIVTAAIAEEVRRRVGGAVLIDETVVRDALGFPHVTTTAWSEAGLHISAFAAEHLARLGYIAVISAPPLQREVVAAVRRRLRDVTGVPCLLVHVETGHRAGTIEYDPPRDPDLHISQEVTVGVAAEMVCRLIGDTAAANLQRGSLYPNDPREDDDA